MAAWILTLIEQGGYWGIAFLMFLENVFPPIPSELIMGMGGIAMARGTMAFWPLLIAGTIGSTLGNYVWFIIGDRCGYHRLRPMVMRWGRWLTLDWQDVEAASRFFRRHGQWIVFARQVSPWITCVCGHFPLRRACARSSRRIRAATSWSRIATRSCGR